MNILVTGCMGFIGSNLVSKLLNSGHRVIGFDNNSNPSISPTDRIKKESGENWKNFVFFKVDILSLEHMLSVCANYQPDAIIHLAAMGSVPRSFDEPTKFASVNEIGFMQVMYLAQVFKVKKFIYASSSSVYGDTQVLPRTEGEEGKPLSPYALSKQHNEHVARIWKDTYDFNSIGLRFFNVYGPGQRFDLPHNAVIPKWIHSRDISVFGDGDASRDFTFVSDACDTVYACLLGNQSHYIANVGTGSATTLKRLAEIISNGKKQITYKEPRGCDVQASVASTTKLREMIGYKPSTTIDEGIALTKAYYDSI